MKKILSLILGLTLLLGIFSPTFAVEEASDEAEIKGTSEEIVEVNSFELFWPVVAGKTRGDSLYGLKRIKEKVRGWFIFGKAQKADYQISLATKRVVEAEKLMNEERQENIIETFEEAIETVDKGREYWGKVENKADEGNAMVNVKKQLSNIETFLNYLESKSDGEIKEMINNLNKKVGDFIVNI